MIRHRLLRPLLLGSLTAIGIVIAAAIPGCSGCKGKAPLNFVPEDALLVVVVPSVSGALKETKVLLDKFRDQSPIKMGLDQGKAQLVKELGFDPERPETLKGKGINPESGLVASLAGDGEGATIAVGVEDEKVLEKFLRELALRMLGGNTTFQEKSFSGTKVTLVVGEEGEGSPPRAAWGYAGKHVIICFRAKENKLGEQVAALTKLEKNIKSNKAFTSLRDKIGKHQVMLYVDGGSARKLVAAKTEELLKTTSEWGKKYIKERQEVQNGVLSYFNGVGLGAELSSKGAALRGYLAVPPEKGKSIQQIFKGTGDAPPFGKYIGPDALAVGRISVDLKRLMDRLLEIVPAREKRNIYNGMEQLERETQLNPEKDVLALLAGRYGMALFAPSSEAIKAGPPRSPAEIISLLPAVAMAQVTDPKRAGELLVKLERFLVMQQMEVRARSQGERKVYTLESEGRPLLSWTIAKDLAIVATGNRLERTVALVEKGGDNVLGEIDSSRAKSQLKNDEGIVFYYNINKTAELIRGMNLPAEIKIILSTALSVLAKFTDLTVDFEVEEDGIFGELEVRVQ